jgi:hypothetical protein
MKKRFYDFSRANAIIVLLAYFFTFSLSLYILFTSDEGLIGKIIFNGLLALSLIFIIIYYVCFPVKIKNNLVIHYKKKIPLNHLTCFIRPNYRLRYDEIIFRDKRIPYDELSDKAIKKNEIKVQYFPEYEIFIEEKLGIKMETKGVINVKKRKR